MPNFRVTIGLQQGVLGATETYISGDVDPTAIGGRVQTLMNLRNAMLYDSTSWVGVRLSAVDYSSGQPVSQRRSAFYGPGEWPGPVENTLLFTVPARGLIETGTGDANPDQIRAALQIRMSFDTDRTTTRYLACVPDSILKQEPSSAILNNYPAWYQAYKAFRIELTSGRWFLAGRSRGGAFVPRPIQGWVRAAAAPQELGLVLPAAPAPGIVAGMTVQVSGVRRRGSDQTSYNGKYFVSAVNTTLQPDNVIVFLRGTELGDPSSIRLPGTVSRIGYALFSIQKYQWIRACVHSRGTPFLRPRGRRRQRTYLGS